ncbi:hypothetical protein Nepgr_001369 [Nepenthes gracilis]|uniref:Late embryogenesis abundant protein LEA-2 subgroup domain-containing protein n=1 Tax=Nepenthes gracilis TaxID=150966 RepID=A0AAD3P5X1_NEPGR|nr:hypothetical protein Nepgr_001369 [Nepenthes gracilis]
MAENQRQRIHPLPDVEAPPPPPPPGSPPPSAPLLPANTTTSEKGYPAAPAPYPPPIQRTIPLAYSRPPKRRNCFCRCLCFLFSLLLLLLLIIGVIVGIFFLVFHPKIPKYSINSLRITDFNLGNDGSLSATFDVNITAWNPNKKIGIYYEGGSHVTVWYEDTELCQGSLPSFYQGHRNTTVMDVALSGETQNATALVSSVQEEQQQEGSIPLVIRGKVPIKIKVGKLKLMKMKFKVKCGLTVASLSASDDEIRISSSSCKIRPHF